MSQVAPEAVYEAVRAAALDEPTPIPHDDIRFDDFLREWNEPDTDLESSTAVLDEDGNVVAFTFLNVAGERAQHGFTGTVREHRGRGLATVGEAVGATDGRGARSNARDDVERGGERGDARDQPQARLRTDRRARDPRPRSLVVRSRGTLSRLE